MAHRDALLQVLPPLPNNNTKHATTTTTNTNHAAAAAATTTTTINASPATGSTTTSIASATAATLITTTTKLVDRQKHRPFRRSSAGRRRAAPARICLEAWLVAFGRRFGFPASALKGMDGFKGQMEGCWTGRMGMWRRPVWAWWECVHGFGRQLCPRIRDSDAEPQCMRCPLYSLPIDGLRRETRLPIHVIIIHEPQHQN